VKYPPVPEAAAVLSLRRSAAVGVTVTLVRHWTDEVDVVRAIGTHVVDAVLTDLRLYNRHQWTLREMTGWT